MALKATTPVRRGAMALSVDAGAVQIEVCGVMLILLAPIDRAQSQSSSRRVPARHMGLTAMRGCIAGTGVTAVGRSG